MNINKEGSKLLMELFNRMTHKQKENFPKDLSLELGDFMFANGYRFVFDKWYLQERPNA